MNYTYKSFGIAVSLITALMLILLGCEGCEKTKKPTPPDPTAGTTLLVCNYAGGAGNLTLIDLSNGFVRQRAAGLGNVPNDIVRRGNRFYVVNSWSNDMNVFDLSAMNVVTQVDTVDIGRTGNRSPQFATLAETGEIYISNFNDNTVTVYNPTDNRIVAFIPVGPKPQDILAVGSKVYVANCNFNADSMKYGPGSISVISTTTNRVIYELPAGSVPPVNPRFFALDQSNKLHIVCGGGATYFAGDKPGEIWKYSTLADTLEQVINIGGTPGDITINRYGFAYVAAGGWQIDNAQYGVVYRYNAATGQILNGPQNPIRTSLGAIRVLAAPTGAVYVACYDADKVEKIEGDRITYSELVGDDPGPMAIMPR